jgi:hypothetical protein
MFALMDRPKMTRALKNRRYAALILVGSVVALLGHDYWWRWLGLLTMVVALVLWWKAGPGWWDEGVD